MTVGDAGEAVRDLQRRLVAAGVDTGPMVPGVFCPATEASVRSFQAARGLKVDGTCGPQTWSALVEASYELGDRVLYLRSPMLRGDDVADLQRDLGRLGFDAGRVDGIYGPLTAGALAEFQRNVGLEPDGICGFATLRALRRVGGRRGRAAAVAAVREEERLWASPRTLAGHRVVVAQSGGLSAPVRAASRALRHAGATVITVDDPDGSRQAAAANAFSATVFLGFAGAVEGCSAAYYAVPGFESLGGRRLARLIAAAVAPVLDAPAFTVRGMRLPVLRETQMPAVMCELAPVRRVAERAPHLGTTIARALAEWVAEPPVPGTTV